jgi:hypothetical protein
VLKSASKWTFQHLPASTRPDKTNQQHMT